MKKELSSKRKKIFGISAQAMVEFAIALPVLLVLLFGIMEVSRLVLMYALVVNASRDAVRYASSVGIDSSGSPYQRYKYCSGIRNQAIKSGYFLKLQSSDITISYDDGANLPNGTPNSLGVCDATSGEDGDITSVDTGDRVTITVTKTYSPLVKLLPIPNKNISATSSRTILGIVDLEN